MTSGGLGRGVQLVFVLGPLTEWAGGRLPLSAASLAGLA